MSMHRANSTPVKDENQSREKTEETVERPFSDEGKQEIPASYTAEDMRQGEIVLKTKRSRYIFGGAVLAAFIAFVVVAFNAAS